jgi:primosomal protein N' (replication factor Y)
VTQGALFETPQPSESPAPGRYVRVVVERGIDQAKEPSRSRDDEGLTYLDRTGLLRVGDSVRVPLGRGDTPAGGIVIQTGGPELALGLKRGSVKPVESVRGGRLPESLIELARWMATYYVCPLGMVLATMTPAAVKKRAGVRRTTLLARAGTPGTIPDSLREFAAEVLALDAGVFPISAAALALRQGERTRRRVNQLVKLGLLVEEEHSTIVPRGEAGMLTGDSDDAAASPNAQISPQLAPQLAPQLTPDQSAAADAIERALGTFRVHLLHGVTGSGKTEVYLRVIERALALGKAAIVLVPEIALTPQTSARFTSRLGASRVAVLHSGLTPTQRHHEWARLSEGRASVVVGARSAVFAPLMNLGVVIVDEEHDTSYKQDQLPRYHGRDAAIKRAQLESCPVVLGSATPSLESWNNARPEGPARFTLLSMPRRVGGGTLPKVEIVDMREERRVLREGGESTLRNVGPRLLAALHETLGGGGQAIVLLNRRGFASRIACPDARCGFVLSCSLCDAGMVHHKDRALPLGALVRCHHCLSEQKLPVLCPTCGRRLTSLGAGTQKAEEELEGLLASHGLERGRTLVRVDSDTMKRGSDYFRALSRFARGEVRVLLGTQMIAKGLDVANVRLVGVLDADTALHLPDFRCHERTFQLLCQVAGRAGRGAKPGRVIVQTLDPTNPAIQAAAAHDFLRFAHDELRGRERFGLPPFTRMARIVCRDASADKARHAADAIVRALREHDPSRAAGIEGPSECPISRIAGHYRFAAEVLCPSPAMLTSLLNAVRARGLLKSDAKTAVDVDPVALM